jgi:hypothetical protein
MVVPASLAEQIRFGVAGGLGGTGGNSLTVNVHAIDALSVMTWLRTGGGEMISRYVSQNWSANPSMRPAY